MHLQNLMIVGHESVKSPFALYKQDYDVVRLAEALKHVRIVWGTRTSSFLEHVHQFVCGETFLFRSLPFFLLSSLISSVFLTHKFVLCYIPFFK